MRKPPYYTPMMSVPSASIAAHMQTTAESLQKTYIRPIVDPSTLPPQCLQLI
jgi:hypothetical protein